MQHILLDVGGDRSTRRYGVQLLVINDGERICEVIDSSDDPLYRRLTLLDLRLLQLTMSPGPWGVWIVNEVHHFEGLLIELGPYGGSATPLLVCPELTVQTSEAT